MTVSRQWLDWRQPCLPAAATWLIDQRAGVSHPGDTVRRGVCDLDRVVCITPGRRAGRVLIEQLLRLCEQRSMHLVPPKTITPGAITATLMSPPAAGGAMASAAEVALAWTATLRDAPADVIAPLVPHPPKADDLLAWQELAQTIQRLHSELAGQRLSFADVADRAERLELINEANRWRTLAGLHKQYERVLAKHSLVDSDAVNEHAVDELAIDENLHLVLIGIVEVNAMQRAVIEAVASRGGDVPSVTALIHAPSSLSDRFDNLGCVRTEHWTEAPVGLADDQIIVADRPDDQSQAALRTIASFDGHFAAEEMTIGLGDPALAENVLHAAEWAKLAVHPADGVSVSRTAPYRLLDAVAAWLDGRRFADFAALLRHADLERWLHHRLDSKGKANGQVDHAIGDWIALLDRYFADHLHQRLDGPSGGWLGDPERQRRLKRVYNAVHALLKPLARKSEQLLGQWSEPVLAVLREIYADDSQLAHNTRQAALHLRDVLAAQAMIAEPLQPKVDAATAIRLALRAAADEPITAQLRSDQIEVLGWLELHLDPAPALIVLGVNDGQVPKAVTADAFLPDGLRTALGLTNNARRYARDAYLLQAMANSRERLAIITGRRAADGEPLTPSRLLLACEPDQLPQRVQRLCGEGASQRWPNPIGAPQPREQCAFIEMPPPPDEPPVVERMSVTSFKSYIACPYRFWLGYIERLDSVCDDAEELDAMGFGSLAHEVLSMFGQDESIRDSADARAIEKFLIERVDALAADRFGTRPLPAVRVQLARLKARLHGFAVCQSQLRTEGWQVQQSEWRLPEQTHLDIPGQEPMRITGIIDRIDYNDSTGAYRIIDYKTSESGASPFEVHHGVKSYCEDRWHDLQLPLYRFLASQHGIDGTVELGYIVLPKDANNVCFLPGPWTEEQLAAGIDLARQIVMNVRAGEFEPNPDFDGRFDDFATICRTNVLGGEDDEEEAA